MRKRQRRQLPAALSYFSSHSNDGNVSHLSGLCQRQALLASPTCQSYSLFWRLSMATVFLPLSPIETTAEPLNRAIYFLLKRTFNLQAVKHFTSWSSGLSFCG